MFKVDCICSEWGHYVIAVAPVDMTQNALIAEMACLRRNSDREYGWSPRGTRSGRVYKAPTDCARYVELDNELVLRQAAVLDDRVARGAKGFVEY